MAHRKVIVPYQLYTASFFFLNNNNKKISGFKKNKWYGPGLKNPSSNARGMGSIPGWETKIPHATRQLGPNY